MNNDNFIGNVIDSKITYQGRRGRQDCQDHVLANILKKKPGVVEADARSGCGDLACQRSSVAALLIKNCVNF